MANMAIINRLQNLGLREAAETLKNEIRERYKRLGETRANANEKAELEMWEAMRPAVERIEKAKQPDDSTPLSGCPENVDQFLDPNYFESNPANWLRDGLLWTAAEIRRVVIDSPDGTTINLALAKSRPPTAWAVFCLEAFARKPPDKRAELIGRVLPFASKVHDPAINQAYLPEGYLDSLD